MFLQEVSAKLTAGGLTTGYSVIRNLLPDSPDKVIALFETGGLASERFLGGSATLVRPGLQIKVRGAANDNDTPRTTMEAIHLAMQDWGAFTQSGVKYLGFDPIQQPFLLERDANGRVVIAVNYLALKAAA